MATTLILTPVDRAAARARNARTWERCAAALVAGRVAEAVAQCAPDARLELAEPVGGLPAAVSGAPGLVATWQGLVVAVRRARVLRRGFEPTADPDVAIVEHALEVQLRDGTVRTVELRSSVTFAGDRVVAVRDEPGSGLGELVEAVLDGARRV